MPWMNKMQQIEPYSVQSKFTLLNLAPNLRQCSRPGLLVDSTPRASSSKRPRFIVHIISVRLVESGPSPSHNLERRSKAVACGLAVVANRIPPNQVVPRAGHADRQLLRKTAIDTLQNGAIFHNGIFSVIRISVHP
jgi:hypothetical protein